ncbi:MAG: prephenate dehydrogenase [Erysipelotrichaceae bacterium]|nr:prephenate dehydrogenase [Erysipelotrichaceae bacterium]
MLNKETHFHIVGLGLMGGSIAMGLKKHGFTVTAMDIDPNAIEYALQHHLIDEGSTQENAFLQNADFIISGLYPSVLLEWINKYASEFKPGALITDVTGVKAQIIEPVQALLPETVEFVGSHPMAGRETSGVQFSDCKMFKPANYIIVPTEKNTEEGIRKIHEFAELLNFRHISVLSIEEHDQMIAFLSQLTHVIAVTLMNTHDNTHLVEYTGDSFRDLTRIAKINEHLWTELFLLNKDNLLQEINVFQNELTHFKQVLEKEDIDEMKRLFVQSTIRRKQFDRKGN